MADDSLIATKPTEASQAEATSTPVFGSASTFGTGTGFAGFSASGSISKPAETEETEASAPDEEECQATFKPVVELEEVETTTGEELEDQLLEMKCKLYRFDQGASEWKERGVGHVRFLQNKENKKIRLLMRQEKTLKIRANHIVMPGTHLEEHSGSDKTWVYTTVDFADEAMRNEMFAIRFGSVEKAQEFKTEFEKAAAVNAKLLSSDDEIPAELPGNETETEAEKLAEEVEEKATIETK